MPKIGISGGHPFLCTLYFLLSTKSPYRKAAITSSDAVYFKREDTCRRHRRENLIEPISSFSLPQPAASSHCHYQTNPALPAAYGAPASGLNAETVELCYPTYLPLCVRRPCYSCCSRCSVSGALSLCAKPAWVGCVDLDKAQSEPTRQALIRAYAHPHQDSYV